MSYFLAVDEYIKLTTIIIITYLIDLNLSSRFMLKLTKSGELNNVDEYRNNSIC